MEWLIPRIYDENGHFLYEAVQTSSGYMSHKRGGTWLPCSCTTGTLAVEWNRAETSCISSIIIVCPNWTLRGKTWCSSLWHITQKVTALLIYFFLNNWYFRHDFTLCNSRSAFGNLNRNICLQGNPRFPCLILLQWSFCMFLSWSDEGKKGTF